MHTARWVRQARSDESRALTDVSTSPCHQLMADGPLWGVLRKASDPQEGVRTPAGASRESHTVTRPGPRPRSGRP